MLQIFSIHLDWAPLSSDQAQEELCAVLIGRLLSLRQVQNNSNSDDRSRRKRLSATHVDEMVTSKSAWYGITHTNDRHQSIVLLTDTDHTWCCFSWTVTSVRSRLVMDRYRYLKGVQCTRHSPLCYANFPFKDGWFSLRMKYDGLKWNYGKLLSAMVAQSLNGNMKLAGASVKLNA